MRVVGFALVAVAVLALLVYVHRYVWRRLVGDTTTPGSPWRTAGTVAAYALPLLSVGALVSGRTGTPFPLQQVLAWPGFLWLAVLLYLTLALLVGEAVRPLLRRWLARRAPAAPMREPEPAPVSVPAKESAPAPEPAPEPAPAPAPGDASRRL
ncbi:metallophosphoesterase, partial [Streptomyces sp. NPDC057509]